MHINIIRVRHFLYLLYLCPWLDLGRSMSYLRDLFFIYIFIFVMINRIISRIQTHLFFYLFFRMCCIIFGWRIIIFKYQKFSFSLALLIKVLLIKKACNPMTKTFAVIKSFLWREINRLTVFSETRRLRTGIVSQVSLRCN